MSNAQPAPPSPRARILRSVLPAVVSLAILALLFSQLDLAAVAGALRLDAGLRILAIIGGYALISLGLEALSLLRLLHRPSETLQIGHAARLKAASYLLGTLNYGLGAGGLSYLLSRGAGVGIGRAAGVVVLISAFDFAILLALSSIGVAAYGSNIAALSTPVVVVGLGALLLALLGARAASRLGLLERLRGMSILDALAETPVPRLAELVGLRLLFVGGFVSMVGLSLAAFGISVPLGELALGVTLISLVSVLPIAAAGLGTGQAAFVYVFREYGDAEALLACSLTLSAGLILLRGGLGAIFAREYAREASQALRD